MPLTQADLIRLTAEGLIRNFGDDALEEAERVGRRFAAKSDTTPQILWAAVAQEIRAMRPRP